ncbi:hypothetical protein tb265_14190 [Gemmatimonadetes bacterium T265]|nr:hypothetical protein tb265_14190 [Gemmatimonadetes bacterium T265]
MVKSLRAPERLFRVAGWLVSLVFAGFLIGFGGKLVGDLPGVTQDLTLEQFVDPRASRPAAALRDSLARTQREQQAARDRAVLDSTAAGNAYRTARDGLQNWIATRTATVDPRQDPEVVRRTRELDALQDAERAAQARLERLDAAALATTQAADAAERREAALRGAAEGRYERARFRQELRVFGIRLLLTLPLLVVGGWLVARKRGDERWPLYRGFVIFALFAFFVELVPYLPSYGGYVRYGVGAALSVVAGVWVIRAMRRYVARREAIERQAEPERRRTLGVEEALQRMSAGVCPACERPIAGRPSASGTVAGAAEGVAPPGTANYCAFCGTHLFDQCPACGTRKNAFYPYCPSCGTRAASVPPADAAGAPALATA